MPPARCRSAKRSLTVARLDSRKPIVASGRLAAVRTSLGSVLPISTLVGATRRRVICGPGGGVGRIGADTSTAAVAWAVCPWPSATETVAVCRPGVAKACATLTPVAAPPSSKRQWMLGAPAPGMHDAAAEKPIVAVAVGRAGGQLIGGAGVDQRRAGSCRPRHRRSRARR